MIGCSIIQRHRSLVAEKGLGLISGGLIKHQIVALNEIIVTVTLTWPWPRQWPWPWVTWGLLTQVSIASSLMYAHMHACMHAHVNVCMHTCMHVCMSVYWGLFIGTRLKILRQQGTVTALFQLIEIEMCALPRCFYPHTRTRARTHTRTHAWI